MNIFEFPGVRGEFVTKEEYDRLTKQRDDLQRENRIIREQHAEVVKQLTDPIVRAKMLEPAPPIYLHTDYDQVKKQRDELVAALKLANEIIYGKGTHMGLLDCIDSYYYGAFNEELKALDTALASVKESK